MTKDDNYIDSIVLKSNKVTTDNKNVVNLNLSFAIKGIIRNVFTQKNWEKAYNKHDNILRLIIELDIKNNGKTIETKKLIRKAILFWTRNPRINHRIWISIVKNDSPYYPLEEEEARTLLFDFQEDIEIDMDQLKKGKL